jgi:hypothetical protein
MPRRKRKKKKSKFEKSNEGAVARAAEKEQEALEKWRKSYMQTQQYFLKYERAKARSARALKRWEDEIEWNRKIDDADGDVWAGVDMDEPPVKHNCNGCPNCTHE